MRVGLLIAAVVLVSNGAGCMWLAFPKIYPLAALGFVLFACGMAMAYHAWEGSRPTRVVSAVTGVAVLLFLGFVVVPFLGYLANPIN